MVNFAQGSMVYDDGCSVMYIRHAYKGLSAKDSCHVFSQSDQQLNARYPFVITGQL